MARAADRAAERAQKAEEMAEKASREEIEDASAALLFVSCPREAARAPEAAPEASSCPPAPFASSGGLRCHERQSWATAVYDAPRVSSLS